MRINKSNNEGERGSGGRQHFQPRPDPVPKMVTHGCTGVRSGCLEETEERQNYLNKSCYQKRLTSTEEI